jgi:hypothetical protein
MASKANQWSAVMNSDTKAPERPNFTQGLNHRVGSVVNFPVRAEPAAHQFTTSDIAWIIRGGVTNKPGRPTHRVSMSPQAARNWLTGAHAKGEIDDEQLKLFWPGGWDQRGEEGGL